MDLIDVWPLFGLRLITPRLELRLARDEDLPGLAAAALAGVHDPDRMPFAFPWTDAQPAELRSEIARFVWRERAGIRRDHWTLTFAVLEGGLPIGVQDLRAGDFGNTGTVSSGSWLTRSRQGQGLGAEMRAGLLMFAFDHLGAEVAESGAADWNAASLGVSRKLGYRDNGEGTYSPRPGERIRELRLRLTPEQFVRPDWRLRVEGGEAACAALIGGQR